MSATGSGYLRPCVAIFCVSFACLTFEIYLSRVLSCLFTEGLLYFPVSLAFLGIGLAGFYLYRKQGRADVNAHERLLLLCSACAVCFLFFTPLINVFSSLMQLQFHFSPLFSFLENIANQEIVKLYFFACLYGLLSAVPFFLSGMIIIMVLRMYSEDASRVYCFDLCGAGLGCVASAIILPQTDVSNITVLCMLCNVIAGLCFIPAKTDRNRRKSMALLVFLSCMVIALLTANGWWRVFEYRPDPNRAGRDFERKLVVEEVWHKWNTYSRVGLLHFKNDDTYKFTINNGSGHATVLPFKPGEPYVYTYDTMWFSPTQMVYACSDPKDILIIFAGAGIDMVEAYSYSHGVSDITGVEINPLIVHKARAVPSFHLQEFFNLPNVHMIVKEGRSFLDQDSKRYDSIVLSWSGASWAYYMGTVGHTNQYLYTKEAFIQYLKHLKPGGTLAVVNLNKIKVLAMAKEAFRECGIPQIEHKVIISTDTNELAKTPDFAGIWEQRQMLFKLTDFSQAEVARVEGLLSRKAKSIICSPFYCHEKYLIYKELLTAPDTKRFLAERAVLNAEQQVNYSVPTDDRPFALNMFSFRMFFNPAFWRSVICHPLGNAVYLDNLFVFLFAAAIAVLGIVLMGLPLFVGKKRVRDYDGTYVVYFSLIGLGFILSELYLMQALGLFLGHPLYSLIIVLAVFLFATGIGSLWSKALFARCIMTSQRISMLAVFLLIITVLVCAYLNAHLLWLQLRIKVAIVVALLFPLGCVLGMFFPSGFSYAAAHKPQLIPFLWGMNSVMSITGSVLSILVSFAMGFRSLMYGAIICYGMLSVLCFLKKRSFST